MGNEDKTREQLIDELAKLQKRVAELESSEAELKRAKDELKDSAEYLVTLNLSDDNINQDTVITAILRSILDMGIAPRKLAEGRSLETQFLEVTGGQTENS